MAENSHLYKSDMVPRNQMDAQKKHSNATSSLQALGRHYGEEVLVPQGVQMGRHEDWNQGASYIENLQMPSSDRAVQPTAQNDSTGTSGLQPGSHSNFSLLQRVRLDPNSAQSMKSSHRRTPSNSINMSSSHDQSQYYSALAVRQPVTRPISSTLYPGPPTQRHLYQSPPALTQQLSDVNKGISHKTSGQHMESRALLEAVRKRDLVEVARLLDKRIDIINAVETGQSALHLAAQMADIKTIEYLIRRGASVSVRDRHGQTPEYYSTKNNISVENMFQSIQLSAKQRKHKHPPSALDWQQSYTGEAIIPESSPYSLDVHHSLALQQQQFRAYKETLMPYLHQGNSLRDPAHQLSLQGKAREEAYNIIHQEPPSQQAKPPSYYHDRFPSPFEHMLRPAQSSSLTFNASINVSRHQTEPSSVKPSRSIEAGGATNPSSDRAQARTDGRKSQEVNHKQYSSSKFISGSEHKKQPSFRIDDLTKTDTAAPLNPTRITESGSRGSSMYSAQHIPDQDGRIPKPPFQNDFYRISTQNNIDSQNRLSAAPVKVATTTPFSPYYASYPHEVAYPINSMVYNPYTPPSAAMQIVSLSKSSPVNCQDPHSIQRSHYASSANQRTTSDLTAKRNPTQRHSNAYQQKVNSTVVPRDSERKVKNVVHSQEETENRYSRNRENTDQHISNSNVSYQAPQPRAKTSLNVVQQHHIDVEACVNFPPSQAVSPETTKHQQKASSLEAGHHHDTDMRSYIRQKSKDTDLRQFLHPSSDQFAPPTTSSQPQHVSRPSVVRRRSLEELKDFSKGRLTKHRAEPRDKSEPVVFSGTVDQERLSTKRDEKLTKHQPLDGNKYSQMSTSSLKGMESSDSSTNQRLSVDAMKSQKNDEKSPVSNKVDPKPKGKRGRKRKHPPVSDEKTDQGVLSTKQATDSEQQKLASPGNDLSLKREKRLRKSETEDEYLYDWAYDDFSSTEPENDDSEDEDFRCPIQSSISSRRGRKPLPRSRSMRLSSRRSLGMNRLSTSFEEHNSDEEEHGSKPLVSTPNKSSKRGRKPKKRMDDVRKKRRGRKKREISSESASSSSFLEEKSDTETEIKRGRKKKTMRVLSSDKEDTFQPDVSQEKTSPKKRGRKKAIDSKSESPKGSKMNFRTSPSKVRSTPTTSDKKNENLNKLSPVEKKKKVKCTTKSVEVDHKTSDKTDRRRRTRSSSEGGSLSASVTSHSEVASPQKRGADTFARTNKIRNETVEESNAEPASSHSLIDLYKGPHCEKSEALEAPLSDVITSSTTSVSEAPMDNQLFGSDLTESEAQVLNAVFQKANNDLTSKGGNIAIEDVFKKMTEVSQTKTTHPPVFSDTKKEISCPTDKIEVTQTPTPEKVKKKRGRKPKSLLAQSNNNDSLAKIVKPSLSDKQPGLTSKAKLKQKNQDKVFGVKPKPVIGGARKGRPPGSLNKSTLKKRLEEKNLKSLKKVGSLQAKSDPWTKPYKTPYKKALADIPLKPKSSLTSPALSTPSKERPPSTPDFRIHSRIPQLKGAESDLPSASPCSSVSSTPNAFKHLHPLKPRASTPLSGIKDRRAPHSSPLPPHMKKLTCNSAIGETVLHKAVRFGYMDNIQHYLEHGFDVNSKDNAGYTALHEACVHGKLKAAKILLEFGADVNINSVDGTRPIHDAVEYDHVEMTRLLLACGADPKLSKFSGRAVKDMIRSKAMGCFLHAYLKELKPLDEETVEDLNSGWSIPASSIFDLEESGCDSLVNPPLEETRFEEMDFELMEEEPANSYLVQAEGSHGRANYYVLSDILQRKNLSRGDFLLDFSTDIKMIFAKDFLEEARRNWVQKKPPITTGELPQTFIELISAERPIEKAISCRVLSNGDVVELHSSSARSNPFPKAYPRGAFCERQDFETVDAACQSVDAKEAFLPEDLPSCSKSPVQSYENCSSPLSFNSQPALESIKPDAVHPVPIFERDSAPPESLELRPEPNLNGISDQATSCYGSALQLNDRKWSPLKFTNEEIETANQYQPVEVPPYTPTSDLNPIDPQRNDPNRVLTETESAVLSLTMDRGYDANLSMMQFPGGREATVYAKLCNEVQQTDSDSKFPLFNNSTESTKKSYNHVSELNERDHAIL